MTITRDNEGKEQLRVVVILVVLSVVFAVGLYYALLLASGG